MPKPQTSPLAPKKPFRGTRCFFGTFFFSIFNPLTFRAQTPKVTSEGAGHCPKGSSVGGLQQLGPNFKRALRGRPPGGPARAIFAPLEPTLSTRYLGEPRPYHDQLRLRRHARGGREAGPLQHRAPNFKSPPRGGPAGHGASHFRPPPHQPKEGGRTQQFCKEFK